MEWTRDFLEIFFPFSCHVCRQPTSVGIVVCNACIHDLKTEVSFPHPINDVHCSVPIWTFGRYERKLAGTIKAIKYRPSKKLFEQIAGAVIQPLLSGPEFSPPDIVVPVPLHPKKEKNRGFNQAEQIARKMAEYLKIPFCPAVKRIRLTIPQAECNQENRRKNLAGAFALADGLIRTLFLGKTVCIVDDVATTGATVEESANPLKNLGIKRVFGLVLAHSPKLI